MSEANAVSLEVLAERVENLEKYIDSQVMSRFNDIQNESFEAFERINGYQERVEKALHLANTTFVADLNKLIQQTNTSLSAEFREKFEKLLESIQQEIVKSIQQEIANSKILAVRPATREEIKSGVAIAVRQANPTEIRNQ